MTLWEFQAAFDGWKDLHRSEDAAPPPMSEEDAAKLGIEGFGS